MTSMNRMLFLWFISIILLHSCYSEKELSYDDDPRPICATDMDFSNIKDRVVGGHNADKDQYTFVAGLLTAYGQEGRVRTDMAMCGASLVTDTHVVTASHCLYGKNNMLSMMRLNIGDYDTGRVDDADNIIRAVKSMKLHENYVDDTFDYDVAIMELNESVPLGRDMRAIILPPENSPLLPGTMCTVWGWGRLSYEGSRPNILQTVDVPVTSRKDCQRHLMHVITENMLCAGGEEGKDACLGDSGGSLLVQVENYRVACGLVSFGKNCALKGVSGVYTDLSRFTNWVYENTRTAGCKPRIFPKERYAKLYEK